MKNGQISFGSILRGMLRFISLPFHLTNTKKTVVSESSDNMKKDQELPPEVPYTLGTGKTYVPDDHKVSVKSLQFDLKDRESRAMFVGLIDELHNQSVLFSLRQSSRDRDWETL